MQTKTVWDPKIRCDLNLVTHKIDVKLYKDKIASKTHGMGLKIHLLYKKKKHHVIKANSPYVASPVYHIER